MRTGSEPVMTPSLQVLSEGQKETLFLRILEFLERIGVQVDHEEGLELLPTPSEDPLALRLREIHSYCEFFEREFPRFMAEWEEAWRKERS